MTTNRISVLLPVYNGAAYLTDCIQSVLDQQFDQFEMVIMDDCSSDESPMILSRISDSRVRVIRSDRNRGLFGTLNVLLKASQAPFVHFLCQDDIMLPGCLEAEYRALTDSRAPAMCVCQAGEINASGQGARYWSLNDLELLWPAEAVQHLWFNGCFPGNLSTVSVRRDVVLSLGGFNTNFRFGGDYELWARVAIKYPVRMIQKHFVLVRDHPARLSRAPSCCVQGISEDRRVRNMLLPTLPEPIRAYAMRYVDARQSVLDVHTCLHLLARFRFRDAWRIIRIMGCRDFGIGLFWWILSADNRLWKPRPRFWVQDALRDGLSAAGV